VDALAGEGHSDQAAAPPAAPAQEGASGLSGWAVTTPTGALCTPAAAAAPRAPRAPRLRPLALLFSDTLVPNDEPPSDQSQQSSLPAPGPEAPRTSAHFSNLWPAGVPPLLAGGALHLRLPDGAAASPAASPAAAWPPASPGSPVQLALALGRVGAKRPRGDSRFKAQSAAGSPALLTPRGCPGRQ
jgi:hypothetical protein